MNELTVQKLPRYLKPYYSSAEESDKELFDLLVSVSKESQHVPMLLIKKGLEAIREDNSGFGFFGRSTNYMYDALKMADQLGKKINILGGDNKIREIHNDLSREVAVRIITDENVTYKPHPVFDKLFKTIRPIKSSRRLGVEGLRQKHCVASYHKRLKENDKTGIFSFVYKGERWTLEMKCSEKPKTAKRIIGTLTESKAVKVSINQLKGKRNSNANDEVRKYIKDDFIKRPWLELTTEKLFDNEIDRAFYLQTQMFRARLGLENRRLGIMARHPE